MFVRSLTFAALLLALPLAAMPASACTVPLTTAYAWDETDVTLTYADLQREDTGTFATNSGPPTGDFVGATTENSLVYAGALLTSPDYVGSTSAFVSAESADAGVYVAAESPHAQEYAFASLANGVYWTFATIDVTLPYALALPGCARDDVQPILDSIRAD